MGLPRFLSENLFNAASQFTGHNLSANEEATGREVFRVADNRRTKTFWTPTTENSSAWVKVDAGSGNTEAADMIVIDRESNLEGETVTLETSPDDSTWTQQFQATLPTSEATDGDISAGNGIITEERAWLKTFSSAEDRFWRLTVSAMGAGNKPQIYGLWLGESWQPNFHLRLPFTWGERRLVGSETTSDVGWRGTTPSNERREAQVGLRLKNKDEYDTARYHIEELYLSGEPMWLVLDEKKAERSWLSKVSPGRTGFEVPQSGWGFQEIRFPAVEHQAAID